MSQRLSRKEIKRDEFMESVGDAVEFAQSNARLLVGIAIAAVVALVVVALVLNQMRGREARADEALSEALELEDAGIDPNAASPQADPPTFSTAEARRERAKSAFEAVREEFGGTDAAAIAGAYLGRIAAQDGDLETARSHWETFVREGSDSSLVVEIRTNLMALDRAQGRGDELVTSLRAMLSGDETDLPRDLLWWELGLTLEDLGRETEAAEAFERLLEDHPQSAYAAAARERSGAAGSSLPGS